MHPIGRQAHVQTVSTSVAENSPRGTAGLRRVAVVVVADLVFIDDLQEVNSETETSDEDIRTSNVSRG